MSMQYSSMELGPIMTNCYIVYDSDTKNVVIHMGISIKDLAQFEFITTKIRRLKDVYAVERYTGGSMQ